MTQPKLWSRNATLRQAARSTSGGPSLGRSPDAQKQRRPVNQEQSPIRENRVDTIFGAGLTKPCSFFIVHRAEFRERRSLARDQITSARHRSNELCRRAAGNGRGVGVFLVFELHGHAAVRTRIHRSSGKNVPLNTLSKLSQRLAERGFNRGKRANKGW